MLKLPHFTHRIKSKLPIAIAFLSLLSAVLQLWQPDFLYVRRAVNDGAWWRILSGQFIHTNWAHYLLNISSLWLFTLLFYNIIRVRTFTISLIILTLSVGLCLHLLDPGIHWYAGLSGAIYGLFLIGAYGAYQENERLMAYAVSVLVVGKVMGDHWFGLLQDNAALIGARVVTESHVYGICTAAILIIIYALYQRIIRHRLSSE